jgi:hypothetical protein
MEGARSQDALVLSMALPSKFKSRAADLCQIPQHTSIEKGFLRCPCRQCVTIVTVLHSRLPLAPDLRMTRHHSRCHLFVGYCALQMV